MQFRGKQALTVALDRFGAYLGDERRFLRQLALLLGVFLLWNLVVTWAHGASAEAVVSAARLVVEAAIVGVVWWLAGRWGTRTALARFLALALIGVASLNSLVVMVQLAEAAQCFDWGFTRIITDGWGLYNEYTRKPGLLNGFQTSTFFSFLALVILTRGQKRAWWNVALFAVNVFPVFFGARTLMVFLPLLFLLHWRGALAATAFLVLGLGLSVGVGCKAVDLITNHMRYRIVQTAVVVVTADPQRDYSARDTLSQYRPVVDMHEFLIGNGQPRFSKEGGGDPLLSRWLLQSGLPAALLVLLITGLLLLRLGQPAVWGDRVFALALFGTSLKAEVVTATGLFSILLLYLLLGRTKISP